MEFVNELIRQFAELYTSDSPAVLKEIENETWKKQLMPRMISGEYQGRILSLISRIKQPGKILEIGTFTGYSAICLAEGLKENGCLISIEINDELEKIILDNWKKAGVANRCKLFIGNALEILQDIDDIFDLVFIDADKENYPDYFKALQKNLKPGSIIIADNVLWNGKVLKPSSAADDTAGIIRYLNLLKSNEQFFNVLLPVRDGLMISLKL